MDAPEYYNFRFHILEGLSRGWPRDVAVQHALEQNPESTRTKEELGAKLDSEQLSHTSILRFAQTNPKLPGSKCHARYERYKTATTLAQMLSLGGTRADARFDRARGYLVFA